MKLTQRQDEILSFFISELDSGKEFVTASEVMESLSAKVERTTIFRDLDALCDNLVLKADGSTKNRVYKLDEKSLAYLEWDLTRPPETRKIVPYNYNVLEEYIPNETFWLGDTEDLTQLYPTSDADADDNYRKVLNALLIDLTYASSRLENVKISWLDTKSLIEFGEQPKGLTKEEMAIVLNHKEAVKFMCEQRGEIGINKRDLCDIHKLLMVDLLGNPQDAGRLRQGIIFFDGSKYKPIDNSFILEEQFRLFCDKAEAIHDPFEKAFFSMLMIPYLQPFQDGNKRTSRLCMNFSLLKNGLAPFSFTTISKRDYMFSLLAFYERGRVDPMSKVFRESYVKSAEKYAETMRYLSEGGSLSTLTYRQVG
jgi:Fic family protein